MRLLEALTAYVAELEEAAAAPILPPVMLPGGCPAPVIRYRPPHTQVPKHDARGDARQLAVEQLTSKQFSPSDAHVIAAAFVDFYADVLHTNYVKYEEDVYETLDGAAGFCKKIEAMVGVFVRKMAAGEVAIPDVPVGWSSWYSCAHAERNKRPKMEDRHIAAHDLTLWKEASPEPEEVGNEADPVALFCVFDGHGGSEVASYATGHMPSVFLEAGGRADEETMKKAFELMDSRLSLRCDREKWRSGATAVVAAVNKKQMALAWCGDSAILVMRSHHVERISKCHSPSDPDEARRVEEAGGCIMSVQGELRVNAVLNVTRSLGDVQGRPMIISVPDTTLVERGSAEYGLILACDGVSDELDDADFYTHIRQFCTTRPLEDWGHLSSHLCGVARTVGSSDNLTCLFVFLRPPCDLWALFAPDPSSDDEQQ
uniref:PPM-type phosphatase domain-containing protein n=1 Tax=Pristionchus pacificus TaxID=54126 RepID=A0A8R1YKD8_PRIPA